MKLNYSRVQFLTPGSEALVDRVSSPLSFLEFLTGSRSKSVRHFE